VPGSDLLCRSRGRCVGLPEPELVSVRVLTGGEPAHARDRHRLICLPAELIDPRRTCFDIVDREVRPCALLARLHVRDRRALLPADLCRVILERAGVRLELPPEQRAPELLAPLGVVRRDLDVHDLTWQRCLLVSSFTAMPPSVVGPRGHVKLIGRRPDAGPPGYFRTRDRISLARSRRMSRLGRMRAGKDWRWRPQPRQFHQRRRLLPGPAVLAAVRRRTRDRRYGQCTQSRRFSRPGDHLAAVRWGTQIIHSVATWRARPTLGLQYR